MLRSIGVGIGFIPLQRPANIGYYRRFHGYSDSPLIASAKQPEE
jgi:hypothetical protein